RPAVSGWKPDGTRVEPERTPKLIEFDCRLQIQKPFVASISTEIVDRAHRGLDAMSGRIAQHLAGAGVVDHAHVANVIELGRGERGGAVLPEALDDALSEEVRY